MSIEGLKADYGGEFPKRPAPMDKNDVVGAKDPMVERIVGEIKRDYECAGYQCRCETAEKHVVIGLEALHTTLLRFKEEVEGEEIKKHIADLQAVLDEKHVDDDWRLEEIRAIISLETRRLKLLSK